MKFINDIEAQAGFKDAGGDLGTAGQLLSSTGTETNWIDQNTISSGTSEVVDIQVKNISSANGGVNLVKGDPVYIYGSVGASARLYVDLADADSTATNNLGDSKMPCVALLDQDLSPNGEGTATVVGKLRNLITSPIDGATPSENDTVYVKSGGGLTLTKPTGSTNLIQNVGQVGRVSTSEDGNIVVAALLRSNDVPNLPEGRIWIGDGNTIVSDTVYVDEPNNRVGIGTTSPALQSAGTGLHLNATTSSELKFTNNTTGITASDGTALVSNGNDFLINNREAGNITLGTSNSVRMTVLSSGNVGIGTTSPLSKFQVNGQASVLGNGFYGLAYLGGTNALSSYNTANKIVMSSNGSTDGLYTGGLHLTRRALTQQGHYGSGIRGISVGTVLQDNALELYTSTNTQQNATRLKITSTGNVGIGTTSPFSKLEVSGDTSNALLTLKSYNGGTNDAFMRFYDESNGPSYSVGLDSSQSLFAIAYGTDGNSLTTGQRFVINNTGNVGIGTTTPTSRLHSVTTVAGPLDYTFRAAVLGINNSTDTFYANSVGVAGKVSTSGGFAIYGDASGAGGWAGYFDGKGYFSGNVGIGIASPSEKLHIGTVSNSTSTVEELRIETGTSGGYGGEAKLWLKNGQYGTSTIGLGPGQAIGTTVLPTTYIKYEDFGNKFYITTNSSTRMFIDGFGNVAIGSTSASYKLDVLGDGRFTNGNQGTVYLGSYGANISSNYSYIQTSSKLHVNGSVKVSDDAETPNINSVGSIRYRTSGNNSYVDMMMQTGASTYAWVNIVTNSW